MSVLSDLRVDVFERQSHRCLWPGCEASLYRFGELAHIRHRGMGGNPDGTRNVSSNVAGLCKTHHLMFDEGPLDPVDLNALLDATLDVSRRIRCQWHNCMAWPVYPAAVRSRGELLGPDRPLCSFHGEICDVSRAVSGRRSAVAELLRVLIDRRDCRIETIRVEEGIL